MFVERRVAFTGDAEKMNLKDAVEAIGVADVLVDLLLSTDLSEREMNELLLIRTGGRASKAVRDITKMSLDKKASPADIKNALGLLEMHAVALESFYKDYAARRGE